MTMERGSRRFDRHKDIPPDAIDETRACKQLHIGYHRLRRLAEDCAAQGGPAVIIPEDNARRFGRWYSGDLIRSLQTMENSRPETAEPDWSTEYDICVALRIGHHRFKALAARVKLNREMLTEYRIQRSSNNQATEFYSPRFREATRLLDLELGSTLKIDKPVRPKPEVELPPPEHLADLTGAEKAAAAINNAELVAELQRVTDRIAQLRLKIGQNRRLTPPDRGRIQQELSRIEEYAQNYSFDMNYRSVSQMVTKIRGLHTVLDRLFIQAR